jgi:hypothetical protein
MKAAIGGGSGKKTPRRVVKAAPKKTKLVRMKRAPERPHKTTGSRNRPAKVTPTGRAAGYGPPSGKSRVTRATPRAKARGTSIDLNPFDAIGGAVRGIGGLISGAVSNVPNPGSLVMKDAEAIRRATRR